MTRNESVGRVLLLIAVLGTPSGMATAQQSSISSDSARAQIHTRLRAFYFSLAHQDWEALTADILAAKVVAHRPVPDALVAAANSRGSTACAASTPPSVEQATIILDGDWAEASVPRCASTLAGSDEFRLIHFDERWRLVYIRLLEEPVIVSTDR